MRWKIVDNLLENLTPSPQVISTEKQASSPPCGRMQTNHDQWERSVAGLGQANWLSHAITLPEKSASIMLVFPCLNELRLCGWCSLMCKCHARTFVPVLSRARFILPTFLDAALHPTHHPLFLNPVPPKIIVQLWFFIVTSFEISYFGVLQVAFAICNPLGVAELFFFFFLIRLHFESRLFSAVTVASE